MVRVKKSSVSEEDTVKPEAKKRGRKPKGGKLITKNINENEREPVPTNVILHLKCSLKEIEEDVIQSNNNLIGDPMDYNAAIPPVVKAYDQLNDDKKFFELSNQEENKYASLKVREKQICPVCKDSNTNTDEREDMESDTKTINAKLKQLKVSLYKNDMDEKKASCFWCTYEFDNQPCYIPKYNDDEVHGYGSFCRPECAVAFLMKESVDDSTKFERYQLLNRVYGEIYDFKNAIKPAPDPYYLLDKYYGNLNIQEYRKLLHSERILLVVNSPLTRILPELHEDIDDFTTGLYGGTKGGSTQAGGVYKVKRQSEKTEKISKTTIMKEQFGITS